MRPRTSLFSRPTPTPSPAPSPVRIATVVDTLDAGARLLVESPGHPGRLPAHPVTADARAARPGDRVVVAADAAGTLLALGLLAAPDNPSPAADTLALASGACAKAPDGPAGARLQVFSERDELLFEYDADRRTLRLSAAADLDISAAGDLRLRGRTVQATADLGVRLAVTDRAGNASAAADLAPGAISLASRAVAIAATEHHVTAARTTIATARLSADVGEARITARVLRTVAKTITTAATDLYHHVERLAQLRAGRARTLIDGTYHLRAEKTVVHAKGNVDIDGKEINLG